MKKSQEAYSAALKALDAAVKSARNAHQSELDKLQAAQEAVDKLAAARGDAVMTVRKAVAAAELDDVKSGFRRKIEAIYADFDGAVAAARRGLVQALNDAALMRASDVDEKAVALLQSGAMQPRDLLQMCGDFSENPAVLAILRREAERQWQNTEDAREQEILTRVLQASETSGAGYVEAFDNAVQIAKTLSSRDRFGNIDASALFSVGLASWENLAAPILTAAELEDGE